MNITLTGNLGSGKGSVSETFKAKGFGYVSGGDIFRGVAKEKGITVVEMNELAKKDRSIDDLIDARSTRLGDELDNTLFDSRLAWNFVRESFKVFLLVDTDESARRVFSGKSREMEEYASQEECAEGLATRANLERDRFSSLYNIDYYAKENYDLIIESTNATPEQIASEIERCFEEYKKQKFATRILLNLKAMYPMTDLTEKELEEVQKAAQKQAKDGAALCLKTPVKIVSDGGYNYLCTGAAEAMAAVAEGAVFASVESFKKSSCCAALTTEGLQAIEKAAGFSYRSLPTEKHVKHDYMMDLSC